MRSFAPTDSALAFPLAESTGSTPHFTSRDKLIIFDADGTIIDAYNAIETAFGQHGLQLGDLGRFQKRHKLFKYLGGIKEFPRNLARHLGGASHKELIGSLTEVYREKAVLYPGIASLIKQIMASKDIRIGLVTRNVTNEPLITLGKLFARHDLDLGAFDYVACIPLKTPKTEYFATARQQLGINPARSYSCGDEHNDYLSAIGSGFSPFMVSYGFEDFQRLTLKYRVPAAIISRTPHELADRVRHGLDLAQE
ncbi:HAD family hydrolase [Chitinibacter bivalviorum]|uniref:phosphoglycolate phosphatase n=1 Tax=Chitinibacter bivalviorum TaxID=2739434 RepID=A0A7H9BM57_9NEIS|nr:HAD family hydrolase [Chitinibacter bivalviorum]QLG89171.1 HAD family hydrolase [Chitinibacter bivalviorum]